MQEPTYITDNEFRELLNKVDPQDIVLMHQVLTINCHSKANARNDDHAEKGVQSKISNTNKLICKPFNFGLFIAAAYILGVLSALWLSCLRIFLCKCRKRKNRKRSNGVELIVKNQPLEEDYGNNNQHKSIENGPENFWKK